MYEQEFNTGNDVTEDVYREDDANKKNSDGLQILFKETCSFVATEAETLESRTTASFEADDFRSLELKFAAMMISQK